MKQIKFTALAIVLTIIAVFVLLPQIGNTQNPDLKKVHLVLERTINGKVEKVDTVINADEIKKFVWSKEDGENTNIQIDFNMSEKFDSSFSYKFECDSLNVLESKRIVLVNVKTEDITLNEDGRQIKTIKGEVNNNLDKKLIIKRMDVDNQTIGDGDNVMIFKTEQGDIINIHGESKDVKKNKLTHDVLVETTDTIFKGTDTIIIKRVDCVTYNNGNVQDLADTANKQFYKVLLNEDIQVNGGDTINKVIKIMVSEDNELEWNDETIKSNNLTPKDIKIIKVTGTDDGQITITVITDEITENEHVNLKKNGVKTEQDPKALKLQPKELNFYPNPNSGKFTLDFGLETDEKTQVKIFDLSGKEIYTEKVKNFEGHYSKEIDISKNNPGTYILQIVQGNKILSKKIILQ